MSDLRRNDDLDAAFAGAGDVNSTRLPKQRRRRKGKPSLDRDQVRRRSFQVLAQLADLGAADRDKVLRCAAYLSRQYPVKEGG